MKRHAPPEIKEAQRFTPGFNASRATPGTIVDLRASGAGSELDHPRDVIDLNDRIVDPTGKTFTYYAEYEPKRRGINQVSFPINKCDPLPIEIGGSIRYFLLSAIGRYSLIFGEPLQILNPRIDRIFVVRAKDFTATNRAQIYIGIDSTDFRLVGYKGSTRIFQGEILAVQTHVLDRDHGDQRRLQLQPNCRHLLNNITGLEVRKYLSDPKDWDWKNPLFQQKFKELFREREGVRVDLQTQSILSSINYWTAEANLLKGIKYSDLSKTPALPVPLTVRSVIDLDDRFVEYVTGSAEYYAEYGAARRSKSEVSFTLTKCDPLPILVGGSIRYFFTSAIAGNVPIIGQPLQILDPRIDRVLVVRAKNSIGIGNRAEVYIGYDSTSCRHVGPNRQTQIFRAEVLAIQTKNRQYVDQKSLFLQPTCRHLLNDVMGLEVRKHLSDPKDFNWNSSVFLDKFKDLFCHGEGVYVSSQLIVSSTCYWTAEENKLKGTKYSTKHGSSGSRLGM